MQKPMHKLMCCSSIIYLSRLKIPSYPARCCWICGFFAFLMWIFTTLRCKRFLSVSNVTFPTSISPSYAAFCPCSRISSMLNWLWMFEPPAPIDSISVWDDPAMSKHRPLPTVRLAPLPKGNDVRFYHFSTNKQPASRRGGTISLCALLPSWEHPTLVGSFRPARARCL